jgi:hypothetical protein
MFRGLLLKVFSARCVPQSDYNLLNIKLSDAPVYLLLSVVDMGVQFR